MHNKILFLSLIIFLSKVCAIKSERTLSELYKGMKVIKDCLSRSFPTVCLKEKALDALNATIMSNEPLNLGFAQIEKNPDYKWNHTEEDDLPEDIRQRSLKLNNVLFDLIEKYFNSRTIKLNVDENFEEARDFDKWSNKLPEPEDCNTIPTSSSDTNNHYTKRKRRGRKKAGGGKGGKGMMMMAVWAVCGMGAGMMMGKMGMMAASAMMMSKLALAMCLVMLLKKLAASGDKGGGDEGGKEVKIVYATSAGSDYGKGGGGGGGGGWHRSLTQDPQTVAYRAYAPQDNNISGGY